MVFLVFTAQIARYDLVHVGLCSERSTPSCDLCWSAPARLCSSLAAECCFGRILEQSNGVLDCVNKLDRCSGVICGGLGQPGASGKTQW